MKLETLALALAITLLAAVAAVAQVPQAVSFQGVLRDDQGDIVSDDLYSIEFKIYDVEAGGEALWTEIQDVEVRDGLFNVILGSSTPLDLAFDVPLWLGIGVESHPELHPRAQLTSAPYAMRAAVADSVRPTAVIDDGDWESSGTSIWHDGWVGVNTGGMLPSYPLDVWGTANFNGVTNLRDHTYFYGDVTHFFGDYDLEDGDLNISTGSIVAARIDPLSYFAIEHGSVPFLFCDGSSGYVGIKKLSPAYQLDVDGTVNCTGFRLPTGASGGHVLTSDGNGDATWQAPGAAGLESGRFECQNDYALLVDCNGVQLLQNGARNLFRIHSNLGDASACYAYYLDGAQVSKAALYSGTNYDFTIPFGGTPYHAEVILSRPWGGGAVARVDIYYENTRCGGIWSSSH